jgi:hypothetical protein
VHDHGKAASTRTALYAVHHPCCCTAIRYKSPGEVRSDRGAYKEETRKIILSLDKIRKVGRGSRGWKVITRRMWVLGKSLSS